MLNVRTSQLIIVGNGCGIQADFFPSAWQWKTSDVMLMKMFGLTNKSDRMSTKNIFFMNVILYFCVCVVEADIFSGIPRVTKSGNKIATNHVIGTGEEKM